MYYLPYIDWCCLLILLIGLLLPTVSLSQSFEKIGEYHLPLDEYSGINGSHLQMFGDYIAIGYRASKHINVYDRKNKVLIKTLRFNEDGFGDILTQLGGFAFKNLDDYYVHSYWDRNIYKYTNNLLEECFTIPSNDEYPVLDVTTGCPMYLSDEAIIFSGRLDNHMVSDPPHKSFIKYNIKDGSTELVGVSPHDAKFNNYIAKHKVYYEAVARRNQLVVSFVISDSLFVLDKEFNLVSRKLAKSKFIDRIKPIAEGKVIDDISSDRLNTYLLEDGYGLIKYDKYKKLYYRIARQGVSLQDFYSGKYPRLSVIVLDEELNLVSEHLLPEEKYNLYLTFVSEDGLHIANKNHFENVSKFEIGFDVFAYKR